ncbi:MAG: ferritin family protein [Desulfobacteraceae bacterium]|jgi:rubrerythrin|nr:ferritin family protein [Desulfobacteraceae bacterium]
MAGFVWQEPTVEILMLAMKREEKALRLYNDFQEQADTEDGKNLFKLLCQEEAKHKLALETMYDDYMAEMGDYLEYSQVSSIAEGICAQSKSPLWNKPPAEIGSFSKETSASTVLVQSIPTREQDLRTLEGGLPGGKWVWLIVGGRQV